MPEKNQKKKTSPVLNVIFFIVIMLWLFISTKQMNIWLSGLVALILTALFVVLTMIMERRKK